jgi:hypothetical protein
MTEWSSKYRFLDQCSHSFTSRDKCSEYLARFYTLNSIKKIKKNIFYLPVKNLNRSTFPNRTILGKVDRSKNPLSINLRLKIFRRTKSDQRFHRLYLMMLMTDRFRPKNDLYRIVETVSIKF